MRDGTDPATGPGRRSPLALRPSEDSVTVPAFVIVSSGSPLDSRARRIRAVGSADAGAVGVCLHRGLDDAATWRFERGEMNFPTIPL